MTKYSPSTRLMIMQIVEATEQLKRHLEESERSMQSYGRTKEEAERFSNRSFIFSVCSFVAAPFVILHVVSGMFGRDKKDKSEKV